ncbi:MAG: Ig-like domain-containing protein [Clostridiales Family XIII bacterium]|jgi:flagellar basal body-associated protein FliL|nr:Ig-like domain-containing protein [Clostridiales Family XIII bacterium]
MKNTKRRKRILIAVVAFLIIAIAFAYVLPLAAIAETEAAFGTDDPSVITPNPEWEDLAPEPEPEPEPPLLTILNAPVRIDVGATFAFTCEMKNFPEGTMLDWKTSNTAVAAIGADGRLIAIAPGVVEVTASAGNKRTSVLVTVNELKANRIVLIVGEDVAKTGDNSYEAKVGDVLDFSAKIEPEGAKVEKISWALGNDQVATISGSGRFVAEAKGQTQVTVMAGALANSIVVNIVESGVPLDQITFYIIIGIIAIIIVSAISVVVSYFSRKRKREEAHRRAAAAKRRKEEAGKKGREAAAAMETQRQAPEQRPAQAEERATMKITGTAVGAGISPRENGMDGSERPVTLDDLR